MVLCVMHTCVYLSLSLSFPIFIESALWLCFFSAFFAYPKYVDTKLNHSFCLCGNKFRLLGEKMFLALDKAGFEMLASVLNTPQIIVWKPLPSTGSQFAE